MEDTTSQPVERMSFLDRFLPVWIMLAMAAGLALGRAVPGLSGALERLEVGGISLPIALGLLVMMYPPLAKVRYDKTREIATDKLKANLSRALKWVHRMERLSRPMRLAVMVRSKKMMRLNNLMLVFATLLLMAPAGPIPFSNTLPALALMSFAIGFIQRDGAAVAAGYGFVVATVMYWWKPTLPAKAARVFAMPIRVLERKYYADDLWIGGFAGGGVALGKLSRIFDTKVIDGLFVNGSARVVDLVSGVIRRLQSGALYHYAFAMIVGLIVLLALLIKYWR